MNVSQGAAVGTVVVGSAALLGKGIGMAMPPKNDGFTRQEKGITLIATVIVGAVGAAVGGWGGGIGYPLSGKGAAAGLALLGAATLAGVAAGATSN